MGYVMRSGPLTRSQEWIWLNLYWREKEGIFFPALTQLWDLPGKISAASALTALAEIVARHEILRTIFTFGPDDLPMQVVFGTEGFRIPVSVADISRLDDGPKYTYRADTQSLLGGSSFGGPLWEARLYVAGDYVKKFGLTFEHIVSDGIGLRNWRQQFIGLCQGQEVPRPLLQPLDRQAKEASSYTADDRYDPAEQCPQALVPPVAAAAAHPRFLLSSARYENLLPLVDRICSRSSLSRAMLLMYAVGWLLCRYSGQPKMLYSNTLANRPVGDNGIECQICATDIPFELDESHTFHDSLKALQAVIFQAYAEDRRAGPVTPETRARTLWRRGIGSIIPFYFNFQGPAEAGNTNVTGMPADVKLSWIDHRNRTGEPGDNYTYVYVEDTHLVFDIGTDTEMIPEHIAHAIIELLPRLLRFIADQPSSLVGDAAEILPDDFTAETDCEIIDGSWVNPHSVEQLLRSHPGVRAANVRPESGKLVAYLSLLPDTALFDVHEHVLSALHEHIDIAAPHRYKPLPQASNVDGSAWWPDGVSPGGWMPDTCLPGLAAVTNAERELCAAFREIHGHAPSSLAQTYVTAGGRIVLAPAIIETLRRRGLTGLESHHFSSPCTLRAAARALTPRSASD